MITITSTPEAKIYFQGTNVEITSVLAFVDMTTITGKKIQVPLTIYENQASFDENPSNIMKVDGFDMAKTFDLSNGDNPETWKAQTVQVAHDEYKVYLEGLRFTAVISGI
jgi:hypothetical protein